ncbi:lycopene cyclase domain-containing protein [Nocardia vermiculata]|uniref:Lycopene cyclase domain-containing protein n=1 Tax=Nocardia vermiculata TaxID=257274 RepID=A0A846XYJ9_9NOCA|nr:lycopene cyclase domain-containing protein [Nocardia vermiculata]NKY52266.1 lycopene cyclase domain-containing protein [Nocardia vermiculata]
MGVGGFAYIVPAVAAVAAVCVAECAVLHTGLLRRRTYWVSMVIVLGFQIPVDGMLTRSEAPIVRYNPDHILGWRFPWDIPVEDFLFGFALVTAVLLGWERARQRRARVQP